MGELPKVCALIGIIAFEYKVHKHGILTPQKHVNIKNVQESIYGDEAYHLQHINC